MRSMLAGLLVALIIAAVALVVAGAGSLGVAAIGWLLNRWFDLTQLQGTLIALAVTIGLGYLVYRLASQPAQPESDDWEEWAPDLPGEEPPVVAWRRQRPTPGELPVDRVKGSPPRRK